MRRALFLLEFRRALVPSLSVAVTFTLIVTLIENALVVGRGENPATAWGAAQLVIAFGIGISGLFVGARVFSEEFKRQHHPLLTLLPLPASAGWFVLSTAGLAASILSIAAIVLIRPAMIADGEALKLLGVASLGHVYLYPIGACFALTFRRTLFVPLLGCPLAALVVFETISVDADSSLARSALASVGVVSSMLYFALVGWWIYIRGEFDLPKVRMRHLAGTIAGALLLVLALRVAHPTPVRLEPLWVFHRPQLSVGARHIAIDHTGVTGRHTVTIASIAKGGPTGRWTAVQFGGAVWAPDEELLWVATTDEPLLRLTTLLAPPPPVLATIGVDGTVRSRFRLPGSEIFAFQPLPGRRALALVDDHTGSKIVVVDADGAVRVLEGSGIKGAVQLNRASEGRLVAILGIGRLSRGFLFDGDGLHRLETVPPSGEGQSMPTVIGRQLFVNSTQARAEIERLHPRPPGSPKGEYIYDYVLCDEATTVFYRTPLTSSTAKLEVWERPSRRWKDVAVVYSHPGSEPTLWDDEVSTAFLFWRIATKPAGGQQQNSSVGFPLHAEIDPRRGLAVYVTPSESQFDLSVFDAKLGRAIPLARFEPSPSVVQTAPAGGNSIVVISKTVNRELAAVFKYTAGSGAAEALPAVSTRHAWGLSAVAADGSILFLTREGASRRNRDGVEHLIRLR